MNTVMRSSIAANRRRRFAAAVDVVRPGVPGLARAATVASLLLASPSAFAAPEAPPAPRGVARAPRPALDAAVLPSIRRLGIDTVGNDLAEYRRLLFKEASEASGFAAMPYSRAQLDERLTELAAHAAGETGRYFVVPYQEGSEHGAGADAGEDAGGGPHDGARARARSRLSGEYDLDAWLRSDLSFSPDQIRLRTSLVGAQGGTRGRTLAREDVFLPAGATERQIHEGFLTAISRLSSTLGHDGRVTSLREDLVTLDFGRERGLVAGSRVELGLVFLTAYHPASGEYLRNRRVPTHVVEVLDARDGTSVARVVKRDARALREAATAFGQGPGEALPLLAWRPAPAPVSVSRGKDPWDRPREVVALPLTGGAEEGFGGEGAAERQGDEGFGGEGAAFLARAFGGDDGRGSRDNGTKRVAGSRGARGADDGESGDARVDDQGGQSEDERDQRDDDEYENGGDGGSDGAEGEGRDGGDEGRARRSHARRRDQGPGLIAARVGLGMTFSILETDRGDRYTDFPATVLNTLLGSADVALPRGLVAKPELALRLFTGGDVEGAEVSVKAPVLMPLSETADGRFLAGGELHINLGGVKTIRVEKDLGHLAILGVGEYEAHLPGFGRADVGAGVSLFALLGGRMEGALRVGARPSAGLPPQLGFWARVQKGPEKWFEFDLGATWTFLDREN